ncbi:GAF and ANTAR domain-containing protein [Pseudonocardia nantongensis]|uniref:GAF and ANTAR domain-containing protein n=1 Tax=Pseudonocardia nantongensis TaxID=1181885 RepID=UPI00397CF02A
MVEQNKTGLNRISGVSAADLSAAARALQVARSEDETLAAIVGAAVSTVPSAEQAGISLIHGAGAITARHPTSERIALVDQLQATYREGPCVIALGETHMVVVDDLAAEAARWPRFAPEAAAHGVASMLSLPLFTSADSLGALNLYSSQHASFTPDSHVVGELFAAQAAIALTGARHQTQLEQALRSRDMIGQAKGILMERFGISADDAFAMLVQSSQNTNVKLVDVAQWLTGSTAGAAEQVSGGPIG